MQLARILGNNYPYRMNIPVYDSADLVDGEMVMRHASWHSGANKFYITAYTSASSEAKDTIGVLQASADNCTQTKENAAKYGIGVDTKPDAAISAGGNFMPCIVNPGATYFCFYDQTVAKSCTHAISASTTWTITGLENNIDGGWLFTTDQTDSAATYVGSLRYASASAASSITTAVAVTVATTTDFCKVFPIGHRVTGLNTASTGFLTTIAAETGIYLDVIENWITHDSSPQRNLRYWEHKGLDGLLNLKVEAEVAQLEHCFRMVVA